MAANLDGVRPTSGVGPLTGVGIADAMKPETNATPATGMGLHASRGGPMSPAPTNSAQKTSGSSAVALPAKTKKAIEDALAEVEAAKVRVREAVDSHYAHPDGVDLRSAEQGNLKSARAYLGQVILQEADRSSPRSTLVPKDSANQPPSVTKVREFESKVINDMPMADRDEVVRAIFKSKELRIVGELALASAAMKTVVKNTTDPHLKTEERKSIVADATDYVTQARPEEVMLTQDELADEQLARFRFIADRVTTPTGQFDPYLFFWVKDQVRAGMVAANMDAAHLDKFDHLVASYSNNLAPQ